MEISLQAKLENLHKEFLNANELFEIIKAEFTSQQQLNLIEVANAKNLTIFDDPLHTLRRNYFIEVSTAHNNKTCSLDVDDAELDFDIKHTIEGMFSELHKVSALIQISIKTLNLTQKQNIANHLASVGLDDVEDLGRTKEIAKILETALPDFGIQICESCGCTELNACENGCSWTTDTLCSSCYSISMDESFQELGDVLNPLFIRMNSAMETNKGVNISANEMQALKLTSIGQLISDYLPQRDEK
ncbi:TPA: hypothetical protein MW242_002887 [Acinetobacter baumannii]|nr:hypothetical protein [Acinetobacter baumannii]